MLSTISPAELAPRLGPAIRSRREAVGYTQADVAGRLGVIATAVAKWEAGVNEIKGSHLAVLCDFLGCTVDEIVQDAMELTAPTAAKKRSRILAPRFGAR